MMRTKQPTLHETSEREALRRRVRRMFSSFNHEHWEQCHALIGSSAFNRKPLKFWGFLASWDFLG
jgi:hypothetical protein